MENRGVLLYVDLGKLEDEPYRLSKIYDTLGQYIDDIRRQRDIIYISKMAESLDRLCATYMLKLHGMRPVKESWL
ncbi:MAG: hypothetical protein ACLUEN_02480 [Coprococcus sp.]|uniref:hypothetical protein n=2 Tax=Lachnospiraceae TaxID=186803 RepID=UPI0006C0C6B5|nr:hypothetical protein [Coprococcus eutactus]CUO31544.1 Uncharacterised protein [Coprococcus eutactus]